MRRLDNRAALVTGGANGIGRGIALRLASEGAAVCIVDLEKDALAEAEAELKALGGKVLAVAANCLEASQVESAVSQATAAHGPIDVLVNNIGQSARERQSLFIESTEEVWRFIFETNVFTMLRFTRLIAPGMCERRSGRVINIGSDTAFVGHKKAVDYAASKGAVLGFTRGAAKEFAPYGVTVNAVCPGPTRTRAMERSSPDSVKQAAAAVPLGIIGEPKDHAAMVALLASEEGRYITGQTILINGGQWML